MTLCPVTSGDSDEWCTLESVLADNVQVIKLAKKYKVNYVLIDDRYGIDIDL